MAIERSEVTKFLQRDKYKYEDVRRLGEKEGGANDFVWIDKTRSYEVAHAITAALNGNLSNDETRHIKFNQMLERVVTTLEDRLHKMDSSDGKLKRKDWEHDSEQMLIVYKKQDLPKSKNKV